MMRTATKAGRSKLSIAAAVAIGLTCLLPSMAQAAFGLSAVDGAVSAQDGSAFTQAGGHPYSASTTFELNTHKNAQGHDQMDGGGLKTIQADLPPGLVGNPTATPVCPKSAHIPHFGDVDIGNEVHPSKLCPVSSVVGLAVVKLENAGGELSYQPTPVYNLQPPTGSPARFGFAVVSIDVFLDALLREDGSYGVSIRSRNISQVTPVLGTTVTLWGSPADPSHDSQRCLVLALDVQFFPVPSCNPFSLPNPKGLFSEPSPASYPAVPLITNPTRCTAPGVGLQTDFTAESWEQPTQFGSASFISHLPPGYGLLNPLPPGSWGPPQGPTDCDAVPFDPVTAAAPTTDQAQTSSGLDFRLDVPSDGLLNPQGIAQSHVKKAIVTLPEGTTVNPSSAEGLGVCTPAQYAAEKLGTEAGAGCPNQSKIGSVDVETPLLAEHLTGALYLAQQDDPKTPAHGAENPFDSLLALYMVTRNQERGVFVKLAGKVEPDPRTGQIVSTFDDLPQLPFSSFKLHFREGARAPLVSPPACGTYITQADFVPWSAADPDNPTSAEIAHTTSQFQITRGVGGGPCPTGGTPAFKPGLVAGTINNAAGTYSPFNVRLTRNDGEQEFTNFSIKLPPGVTGKLAGVPFCPDAAIAAAKAKTGGEELASPSCPKASEVGRTLVGAGVGSIQTYVPGRVYLAGPYNGSALSIVAITSAKVGPFDVGTVVIREALKVNPDTAEVFVDATGSDPIPHIIRGIPVHARDIRVYVDKPEFVLNPTNCKRTSTASTVLGSGLDFASAADDNPLTVTSPFQAADCANLGFKPKLALSLSGGTKRGDNPKFKAVLNARAGDANIGEAQVTLPHSAFLDQSHIKTICTRVQFAAGAGNGAECPKASIYGYAKAVTPLLDEPLEGPVFLRSSSHNLPDLVAALNSGKIDIALDGRIDSVGDGQIRNTFEEVPDAPVTRFTLTMQGGKKGLLVNSANLCVRKNRAIAAFTGQNGKVHKFNPVLKAPCGKKAKAKNKKKR